MNMDEGICSRSLYVKSAGCGGEIIGTGKGSGSSKCGRWNPTGEQVKVLTELFRSGLRTPSSDQIQTISHQLSFYGKIESKNVFYWFQNHKARERQKRRKVIQYLYNDNNTNNNNNILPPNSNYFADKSTTNKSRVEMEPEKMMKTLQLFPINSIDETEGGDDNGKQYYEDPTALIYKIDTNMDHPPLDLRLSFM